MPAAVSSSKKYLAAMLTAALSAALLSACASETSQIAGLSPNQAVAKACKATLGAQGITASTKVLSAAGPQLTANLSFAASDARGSLHYGNGASAQVLSHAKTLYLNGNAKFWEKTTAGITIPQSILDRMAGKWLRNSAKSSVPTMRKSILRYGDPKLVLASCSAKGAFFARAGSGEVHGASVERFTGNVNGERISLSVATSGKPYVLLVSSVGGPERLSTEFSDFGKGVDVSIPTPNFDLVPILKILAGIQAMGLNPLG
jgi:hypothetical protein